MKVKSLLLFSVSLSLLMISYISAQRYNSNKPPVHKPSSEGMEDDEASRLKWEVKRLADPSTGKIPDNIRNLELAYAATLPNDGQNNGDRALLSFTNRGLYNVGGKTGALGIDISNENRILAGTHSGGMW